MFSRLLLCLLIAGAFAGCESPYKKSDAAERKPLREAAKDPTFQAFIGRLRTAVSKKDRPMMAQMMAPDFGYRWDNPPPGEVIFDYWDKRKLWGELAEILRKGFEPNENYLVRRRMVLQNYATAGRDAHAGGSWRFAYFVPAPPPGTGESAAPRCRQPARAPSTLQVPPSPL